MECAPAATLRLPMGDAIQFFVEHGSYGLMFAWLIAAGMGAPLPEDVAFISGAILAQRGLTDLRTTVLVLTLGVFLGDTILFFLARRLGPAIYERRFIKRVLPAERRAWIEDKIKRYGGFVVFCARHVAGLRGPTFAIAAIHGISYPRFILWDMLALAVSMPVFMWIGYAFAGSIASITSNAASFEQYAMAGIGGVLLLIGAVHLVRTLVKRAREGQAEAPPPGDASQRPD